MVAIDVSEPWSAGPVGPSPVIPGPSKSDWPGSSAGFARAILSGGGSERAAEAPSD